MDSLAIQSRIATISAISEPSVRVLRLSQLLDALFNEKDGSRIVVVGGSAIELLTDGKYTSGDLDICFNGRRPSLRVITDVMAQIGATGGPRSFRKDSLFIDILGTVETLATTPFRELGGVLVAKPEDLIAERVLMSIYPQPNAECRTCAEKLLAIALSGDLPVDWKEVERVAALPEYGILEELRTMQNSISETISEKGPSL